MGFVRTLLLWLLVLAVPAQGASAATMTFCGPGHHSERQALDGQNETSSGPAHDHHADATEADHEHPHADTDDAVVTGVDAPAQGGHHVKHKCSACASCCSAAALPSAFPVLPAPLLTDSFLALAPPSVAFVPIDGLERPPRSFLA